MTNTPSIIKSQSNAQGNDFLAFESEFKVFLGKCNETTQRDSQIVDVSALESLKDEMFEVYEYLEKFAAGKAPSKFKTKLNGILSVVGAQKLLPFAEQQAALFQRAENEGLSVQDLLNKMFGTFDVKQDELTAIHSAITALQRSLTSQSTQLGLYIEQIKETLRTTDDPSIRLKSMRLATLAESIDIQIQEKLNTRLPAVNVFIEQLVTDLGTLLPVLRKSLNEELAISGALNSIRDTSEMASRMTLLATKISDTNTENMHETIKSVAATMLNSGVDVKQIAKTQERSQEFQNSMQEMTQQVVQKSVDNFNAVADLRSQMKQSQIGADEQMRLALDMPEAGHARVSEVGSSDILYDIRSEPQAQELQDILNTDVAEQLEENMQAVAETREKQGPVKVALGNRRRKKSFRSTKD